MSTNVKHNTFQISIPFNKSLIACELSSSVENEVAEERCGVASVLATAFHGHVSMCHMASPCPAVQIEGQTTHESLAVQVIQEFHLTGVQGLYQLNSHSKLCHLV